jgi:hypothetical protein
MTLARTGASAGTAVTRSGFVTGLAWVFIALAGFATLIAILQNIMLALMFPAEELRATIKESESAQPMPAMARFMFENFRYLFAGFLVFSAGTLVAAIGLLKRKNWARLIFIAIMALGIVWNLASLAMPFMMTSMFPEMPAHPQPDFQDNFRLMWNIMLGFMVVIGLAVTALLAWIIKRLVSSDIKQEFLAG